MRKKHKTCEKTLNGFRYLLFILDVLYYILLFTILIVFAIHYTKTNRFHAIFLPEIFEFSRYTSTYLNAKFELYNIYRHKSLRYRITLLFAVKLKYLRKKIIFYLIIQSNNFIFIPI